MRRLELVATGIIPIFDATSTHQWVSYFTEAAPVASGASLSPDGTRTQLPWRGFSKTRNRAQVAQPTHLVDELTRRRRLIVENIFALKVICNQSHLYRKNGEVAVTSVTLTQLEYNMQFENGWTRPGCLL